MDRRPARGIPEEVQKSFLEDIEKARQTTNPFMEAALKGPKPTSADFIEFLQLHESLVERLRAERKNAAENQNSE